MNYSPPKKLRGFTITAMVVTGIITGSCNRHYSPASLHYRQVSVNHQQGSDTTLAMMLRPYADTVYKRMNKVIGEVAVPLEKKSPESTLGNLLADAMRSEASRVFNQRVDAAFFNYGGIRVQYVAAGPLTLNHVFEMMPFDNQLVIQRLSGKVFQQFLDTVATRGGWPGSGVQYSIKKGRAVNVLVGGVPLNQEGVYVVANSDYIVNGGDNCTMLRAVARENKGFLVRDGLIHYFSAFTERGEKISAKLENRVKNVD